MSTGGSATDGQRDWTCQWPGYQLEPSPGRGRADEWLGGSKACHEPRGHTRSPGVENRLLVWGRLFRERGSEPVKEAVWIREMSAPRMGMGGEDSQDDLEDDRDQEEVY